MEFFSFFRSIQRDIRGRDRGPDSNRLWRLMPQNFGFNGVQTRDEISLSDFVRWATSGSTPHPHTKCGRHPNFTKNAKMSSA